MSRNRKLVKVIRKIYHTLYSFYTILRKNIFWLLRTFLVTKNRQKYKTANAGFVLPTVAMVSLVVVLLTVAILFRSFERSKNASNVRVNETVLKAAMPAVDRAKTKIEQLFSDPTLPRSTPSDASLYNAFTKNLDRYTFGDEQQLQVRYDVNGKNGIESSDSSAALEVREKLNTAWRYPVDTDNDGKYDSFTVYGIFFRSPSRDDSSGKFNRARTPLDARTPPMDDGSLGGLCTAAKGTSASLIGESGWYKAGSKIKKSFFTYVATVPISKEQIQSEELPTIGSKSYKEYTGNKSFSAIEFQQDQERTPIVNNAVVYEDDLDITPGTGLSINGSIFTNSNLLVARSNLPVQFYQVSSPKSCFYQAANSKIIVGGNVGNGRPTTENGNEGKAIPVDLFKPGTKPTAPKNASDGEINGSNKSANNTAADIAFNTQAYAQRINALVNAQIGTNPSDYSKDPSEVKTNIDARYQDNNGLDKAELRREELEAYFKKRTIKVPFAKVGLSTDASTDFAGLQDSGTDKLRGQESWIDPSDDKNTGLKLSENANRLPATEPNKLKEVNKEEEKFVGDRVLVGNNLPALWYDKSINDFVGRKTPQEVKPKTPWDDWSEDKYKYRTRTTKIEQLISLAGATERDGFFELKATEKPKNPLDNVGGMRVVTGAGIYVDGPSSDPDASYPWDSSVDLDKSTSGDQKGSFLKDARPSLDPNLVGNETKKIKPDSLKFKSKDPIVVWSDAMPMTGVVAESKGDLLMRATAVYHYKDGDKDNSSKSQMPIACISSYYDPTNATTARNSPDSDIPSIYASTFPYARAAGGKSNNGVVYPAYTGNRTAVISDYSKQLRQQARLVFPDGRFVNEPLRNALLQFDAEPSKLSMADNSAIDTAVCAIQILGKTIKPDNSKIPHGIIYETAFLDAREVKSVEQTPNVATLPISSSPQYTRSIEERQPLEVRVTALDLNELRQKKNGDSVPSQEYLLPNSGIVYATRDDALADLSESPDKKIGERKLLSPTDYKLDPTRRPSGIMLVNGYRLDRESNFREEEKGLILATNVPAYVWGDFNLHSKGEVSVKPSGEISSTPVEEFAKQLRDKDGKIDWGSFYDRGETPDNNFACRKGDPRLPKDKCATGDSWRPATVLADSVTVLSRNFRLGFRNEGDYDLRNNSGVSIVPNYDVNGDGTVGTASELVLGFDLNGNGNTTDTTVSETNQITSIAVRRHQGFYDNSFVTSALWYGDDRYPRDFDTKDNYQGSTYVNNFVTPIQRRVQYGEYVMEICRKVPIAACTPNDWVVSSTKKASEIPVGTLISAVESGKLISKIDSGTTAALPSITDDQRFPRRVAFLRDPSNKLILDSKGAPVPIGVDRGGKLRYFPYNELKIPVDDSTNKNFKSGSTTTETFKAYSTTDENQRPIERDTALWFRTSGDSSFTNNANRVANYGKQQPLFYSKTLNASNVSGISDYKLGTNEQPLLIPVLQLHLPVGDKDDKGNLPGEDSRGVGAQNNWMQTAVPTVTNLVIAGGDTPNRPSEYNGGLSNFVRYLERWRNFGDQNAINHSISGSLIQYKRSAYATAPWDTLQTDASKNPYNQSIFGYSGFYRTDVNVSSGNGQGRTPFFGAPLRQWGFDVALLSQIPDLFAQQFTLPPTAKPNEFFREVSRDDEWVKTLLCAKIANGTDNPTQNAFSNERPQDFCQSKTGG